MTVWNVGCIGVKQMIRFEDSFSTRVGRAQYCSRIEQDRQQRLLAARENRRRRLTVDQLIARYNI
jgi:hypothetical protein